MINRKTFLVMVFLVLFSLEALPQAPSNPLDLQGLESMEVIVETLRPDAMNTGLSIDELVGLKALSELLKTDVKLILRRKEIAVDESSSSFLYIQVQAMEHRGRFSTYIRIELNEKVTLRNRTLHGATTWNTAFMQSFSNRNRFVQGTRQTVGDMIDEFCNAYLTANPIRQGG